MTNENYGGLLAEKVRETADFKRLTEYEKFILDRGYEYETEADLKASYDRLWKSKHGILITLDEFLTEAKRESGEVEDGPTVEVYNLLAGLVGSGKLTAADVYQYARFKWCLNSPDAIVGYEYNQGKWAVNNCDTEIAEDTARIKVCEEWGFEASRIKIIGTPYYDATDWQFIRFDCACMTWLWCNGNLYQARRGRQPG